VSAIFSGLTKILRHKSPIVRNQRRILLEIIILIEINVASCILETVVYEDQKDLRNSASLGTIVPRASEAHVDSTLERGNVRNVFYE